MKVLHIDHVGIAVKDLEATKKFYTEILGIAPTQADEVVEDQKVKVSFFKMGDAELEFLESTAPDGPIAKFIEKNGEGIQHIALAVEDIRESLAELKSKEVRLIDQEPRYGAGGKEIAFLHPKATGGVLLEICAPKK